MHFSWERVPQLTQARYQYEVSSKEGKEKGRGLFYTAWKDTYVTQNACPERDRRSPPTTNHHHHPHPH